MSSAKWRLFCLGLNVLSGAYDDSYPMEQGLLFVACDGDIHYLPQGSLWWLHGQHPNLGEWLQQLGIFMAYEDMNSLIPGRHNSNLSCVLFKLILSIDSFIIFSRNCLHVNAPGSHWQQVNIVSGSGLVLFGTKPLPKPMLTKS